MNPLVSIIIPAYNSGPWIADTVRSAVSQTWPNKEIIIVDDGSTDDTLSIAKSFESRNVRVLEQANSGACRARNRGLEECQGDFIQWLDADDLLAPNKIAAQLKRCDDREGDTAILFSGAWGKFYYRPQKATFTPTCLWTSLKPIEWLIKRLENPVMMSPAAWLVSRRLTERAGNWDERLRRNQDGEYFFRVVLSSSFVDFASDARCYYRRVNPGSISKETSLGALESVYLSLNLCAERVLAFEDTERTRKACVRKYQDFISLFLADASADTLDLIEKTRRRIHELGGANAPVKIAQRYRLAQTILGRKRAANLRNRVAAMRLRTTVEWDRLLARIGGATIPAG
jgi:glycosyltransferase involved in cell wall biosynthesis